jgi:hypothetical protein
MWEQWGYTMAGSAERKEALNTLPSVLYCDPSFGVWAPLECLYWSSDSHALVSTHPASSTYEISSSYCPGCFSIASSEDGRCATCVDCPVCGAALSPTCGLDGAFYWRCCHCPWDSTDGLTGRSAEELTACLDRVLLQAAKEADGTLALLVAHYSEALNAPAEAQPSSAATRSASWQPSDADAMVARKVAARPASTASPLYASAAAQTAGQAAVATGLLPQRRPLLARKERRSVADVRSGKPGILVGRLEASRARLA